LGKELIVRMNIDAKTITIDDGKNEVTNPEVTVL
jgi:hypothetical protein